MWELYHVWDTFSRSYYQIFKSLLSKGCFAASPESCSLISLDSGDSILMVISGSWRLSASVSMSHAIMLTCSSHSSWIHNWVSWNGSLHYIQVLWSVYPTSMSRSWIVKGLWALSHFLDYTWGHRQHGSVIRFFVLCQTWDKSVKSRVRSWNHATQMCFIARATYWTRHSSFRKGSVA